MTLKLYVMKCLERKICIVKICKNLCILPLTYVTIREFLVRLVMLEKILAQFLNYAIVFLKDLSWCIFFHTAPYMQCKSLYIPVFI